MFSNSRNNQKSIRQRSSQRRCRRSEEMYKCVICHQFHALRFCKKFLRMTVAMREEIVEKHRYCVNCLAKSHDLRSCTSMDTCRKCDQFHHTLLHERPNQRKKSRSTKDKSPQQRKTKGPRSANHQQKPSSSANLSTTPDAKILVEAIRSLAQVLCTNTEVSVD